VTTSKLKVERLEWLNALSELIFDRDFQTPRSSEPQWVLIPLLVLLVGSRRSECSSRLTGTESRLTVSRRGTCLATIEDIAYACG
jgi:hypothetical protein